MEKWYFVTRVNINTQGSQANSIQKFENLVAAQKRFYNILAADIDNAEFIFELVQIVDDRGLVVASQVFDNRVQPEPEE